jgi:biotin carboxyl carrier protein
VNVDVMVNGRPWKVAVEPAEPAGKFTVTIKGKSRTVDASWIDADTLSLIDAGVAREIRFHERTDHNAVGVEIRGRLYEIVATKRGVGAIGATSATGAIGAIGATGAIGAVGATGAMGAVAIKAPMPGRVVRVLVAVGDHVDARQAVVVVEAMKMENELRSPGSGTVQEILVTPGTAVDAGAVLVTVVDQ